MHQIYPVSGIKKLYLFFNTLLTLIFCLNVGNSWGQVSISSFGTAFTQNFDVMGPTGITTPTGWYVGMGTTANGTTVIAGTGSSATGANYNFGSTTTASDRALGSIASSGTSRNTEARFTNNTGGNISSLIVSYDGEQWRLGQAASQESGLVLYYSINGTTYTPMGTGYNFVPPIINGTAGALDGNAAANRIAGIGGTYVPASPIPNNSTFYLRWVDVDNSGSDAAPAIDNFSIKATGTLNPSVNLSVSSNSGSEAAGSVITVTATASAPVSSAQTVDLAVTGAGITAGDYTLSPTTITIPSGATTGTATFTVIDDAVVEGTETATITISNPSSGINLGTTLIQNIIITDNDFPAVNLSVSSNAGTEAGSTVIMVTATASQAVTGAQTVNIGVSGTGITTGDYNLSSTTITIPNGGTTGTVTFTVVDDALVEGTETAILTISSPSGGIILGSTTTQNIVITDNDFPSVNLSVSSNAGTEAGSTVITVTATASQAVSGAQTVNLGVSGTGITAGDYNLSSTTITIPNGATTGTVTFTIVDDAIVEGTETAILTISSPSSGIVLGTTTTQNIAITDDVAPEINVKQAATNYLTGSTYTYSNTTLGNNNDIVFTIQNTGNIPLNITGFSITGSDYSLQGPSPVSSVAAGGTVTFTVRFSPVATGTSTGAFLITNDDADEGSYLVNLSGMGVSGPLPAVTSASPTGTYGTPFTYNIIATNSPNSYAITSGALPAGLSLDLVTGAITGTPTAAVASSVVGISATNLSGTGNGTLTFTINPRSLTISSAAATDKVYDRTAAATITGTLSGILAGDNVTLVGTGTFASVNAGGSIAVTSASTLTGTDAANYTLVQPTGLSASITKKPLTITSAGATSKTYDGNNTATITGTLNGVISPDVVTLNGTGTFATSNAGTGIAVTSTSTLSGAQAGNYMLTQPTGLSADITKKALTISSPSAATKVYDGTATATLSGTLTGVISPDVVTLNLSGTFPAKTVGTGLSVTSTSTISGANAGNYTLIQPTGLTANITPKTLTVTGVTANNKVYDGTNAATLSGGTLVGVIIPDAVTFNGTGIFATSNVGTGIAVTSTSTLTGADAGNYTLTQPTGLFADITAGTCTISTPGSILYNFNPGTPAPSNTVTNLTVSDFSQGNSNGTTPFITTASPSNNTGSSGTYNAGIAARIGVLNTALNGSAYFQFTLTPIAGYTVSLTGIRFDSRSTNTGPANFTLRSSLDGYTTDLATGPLTVTGNPWLFYTPSVTPTTSSVGTAIMYRIYGYNGTGSAGAGTANWRLDDINLSLSLSGSAGLTSATTATVCSGALFNYTPLSSGVSGATFTWTRAAVAGISNPAVTIPQSGGISETLINTTTSPVNVIYNYTINGSNCSNPNQNVTVTVNPAPDVSNLNTTATTPVNAGTASTVTINSSTLANGTYTITYNLTGSNTATGSSATVSFSGGTGSFATPNLTNPGSTTVTITSVSNSTCSSTPASNNTAVISVVNTTIVINSLSATSFCITASTAAPVTIMFTSAGTYNTGNTYTAQLSDGTGSFASPVNIGVLSSTLNTGTINATLPAGSVAGIGYRIRVVASNPVTTGLDNGSDLIISNGPVITIDATNASVFSGNTATFSVVVTNAASYQWQVSTDNGATWANVTTGTGGTTATYTTPATTISMNGYLYRCQIIGASPCNTLSATSAVAVLTVNTAASIWTNPITGSDPGSVSPYTSGDITNPGLTVSGITRSAALPANPGGGLNRYNATNWPLSASIDLTKYFEFVLTPNAGYHINFLNFIYTGQRSSTGPRNFSIRSSLDGYTTDIAAVPAGGTTVNLAIPAFQNITVPIRFRFYGWNATGTTGTYSVDDFTFNGSVDPNCTATKLIFSSAFANTNQDAIIPSFTVSIACASNTVITSCSNGTITLTSSGCGLKGTITQPVINGVATFNDIHFSRSLQTSVSFSANYSGTCGTYTPALSNTFNVGFNGMGAPVTSDLRNENFDGSTPAWSYIIGTPTYTNTGSGTGTDVTGIKNFSGNNVMAKSFSVDNSSGSKGSTNTVTFSNVTGLGSYTSLNFSFQIGCIPVGPVGSGAGADNGEYLYIECSLDGGITWKRTLTNNGSGNHGFNLSPASPVSLQYDANAVYSSGNNLWGQSAFQVTLPPGTSQFMFRMIANDNRTNENWVVDNLLLQGTTIGSGTQSPLPVVTAYDILACPGSSNTISFSVANGVGTLSYLWTPNTNISSTTVNNPVVNPTVSTTYKGVVTDADGCKDSANIAVTVPSGPTGTWTGMVSKDYFNCLNWADGVVPVSTTDVSINTTVNSVEIDATSPFAGGFGNTATANNLAISNNNINFILGTEKLNLSNLSINSGANINMTNGGTINLTGIWNNSVGAAGFTSGIGMVNYSGTLAQTIAPENYYNLTSSSTGTRTIPGMGVVGISNIFDAGTNAFTLATGSTVDFNGGIAQVVPALDYYNLNLSNNDIKTIAGNTSVSGTMKLKDAASLALGASYLTLKSTVTGTAIVAPITTTASTPISYTSGKVVVERYYPARRSWRLITAPVSTTRTIYNEWQVGGVDYMTSPNSGIYITSPISTDPGLDLSAHYSIKKFDQPTGNLVNIANTKVPISGNLQLPDVPDNIGYFVFVRGDRKMSLLNPYPITNARITTLRDTGVLQTGRKIFNASDTGFMLIGNPYASPVDFGSLGRSGVQRKFYAWDPRLNSYLGAYVVVDGLTPPGYIISPSPDPMIGTTGQDSIIQSSQAIFVHANTATANVTFNETSKATEDNNTVFRPAIVESNKVYSSLRTNLYLSNSDSAILADGVYTQFDTDFSSSVDSLDAVKFTNFLENFAIMQNGKTLMFERRLPVNSNDTIFFKLWNTTERKYELRLSAKGLGGNGLEGYLEDIYLKTKTPLNLDGYTNVSFSITSDQASKVSNRFMIVFKSAASGPLLLTFSKIKAYQQDKNINVEWNVSNEISIKNYEVERSMTGQEFTTASIINPIKNNNSDVDYLWPDEDVTAGTYYYRIKSIGTNGEIKYSNTVKVIIGKGLALITIYPNPIINGNINVHFINQPEGIYYLKLINPLGQNVYSKQVEHLEGSSLEILRPGKKMAHGSYQLKIMKPDGTTYISKVIY